MSIYAHTSEERDWWVRSGESGESKEEVPRPELCRRVDRRVWEKMVGPVLNGLSWGAHGASR